MMPGSLQGSPVAQATRQISGYSVQKPVRPISAALQSESICRMKRWYRSVTMLDTTKDPELLTALHQGKVVKSYSAPFRVKVYSS